MTCKNDDESPDQMPYDVFISYRRDGGSAEARLLRQLLIAEGCRVFLDVTDLKKGYFDEALLRHIAEAANFIVVLSQNSLERCANEDDWLRREIEQAIATHRNIIPVLMDGFRWPATMPTGMQSLSRHQGIPYSHVYFDAMMARILESIRLDRAEREQKPPAPPPVIVQPQADPRLAIFTVEGAAKVHWKERVRIAEQFGKSGDPRLRRPWEQDYWVDVSHAAIKIGRYPVTVFEYAKYVAEADVAPPADWNEQSQHSNRPVTSVNHAEAVAYCRFSRCRLPTGQEWERVAAGVERRKYPWGHEVPDSDRLNAEGNVGMPSPVGAFPKGCTPEGVSDMAGNVWEWTDTRVRGSWFELRGGAYGNDREFARCSVRHELIPEARFANVGFRCAKD